MERVAVLGASKKEDRYSNMAVKLLKEFDHEVFPVNPVADEIHGFSVIKSLDDLPKDIDTLTLYVNPTLVDKQVDDIIKLSPKRVIFNPGTESEKSMEKIENSGIKVVKGCTLVMLKTGQY